MKRALLLAVVALSLPALAQDGLVATPKGGADEEAAELIDDSLVPMEQDDALKLFAGTWRCTGTSSTELGADVPTTFTITGKKDLGGRWLVVRSELLPKAKGAKPLVSEELWGWSRAKTSLVRSGATSTGGFITSTSTGWAGERFAWTGTSSAHAKPAKEKLSFEKKSDKELNVEVSLGVEELRVVFEGVCKK
ncbi:MAG: hypothetical protein Q8O67_04945 [Deltaproteobacteria bacterium]|nr:hypothetical protein [Deltaproteobacteria bacterium]